MNPPDLIQKTIDELTTLKGQPNVNVKWFNKTISRLEEAWACSQNVLPSKMNMHPSQKIGGLESPLNGQTKKLCTCPVGAIEVGCPFH